MGRSESAGCTTPVFALDEVGSTSSEALARARAGQAGPLWVTAACQTAGRGRRGRIWSSERGNLYASLLLTDPAPPELCPQLCFVAGVALHDAVSAMTGFGLPRLALKWPNDLLIDGGKCAGILVEGEIAPSGRPLAAAIGFGVNCRHHPDGLAYPATDLTTAGAFVEPDRLLGALDAAVAVRLADWNRGLGFAVIRADWLACAGDLGRVLAVRTGEEVVSGVFETLDDGGALVLRRDDGSRRRIGTGDVLPMTSAQEGRS